LESAPLMQTSIELLQRLNQHRAWVNANLLAVASSLTEDQLRQTFAIGQGSVWKSLLHMFAAEYVWLEALLGDAESLCPGDIRGKLPGNQLGEGAITKFSQLQENWAALQKRWDDYLVTLPPASLDDPVYKVSSSTGERIATRRADVLLHVCTHAHYTAAQVVNMLRQLRLEKLPETMLISLARGGNWVASTAKS
jgi:uncharacterized damage-inducible protein DinB